MTQTQTIAGAKRRMALGTTAMAALALAFASPLTAQTMPDPAQPGTMREGAMQPGTAAPGTVQPGAPDGATDRSGPVRQALPEPATTPRTGPTEATSGLPYCSRSVTDRCIQRGDVGRPG